MIVVVKAGRCELIRMTMGLVGALALLSISPVAGAAGTDSTLTGRAYGKLSYLWLSPSLADMGHSSLGGALGPFASASHVGVGAGAQFLRSPSSAAAGGVAWGVDVGAGTLWSDELDYVYEGDPAGEVYTDRELALYALGIAEYSLPRRPVLFQGGAGVYGIFWSWTQDYPSGGAQDSGVSGHLGLMGAVGYRVRIPPGYTVPITVRLDYVGRHGGMMGMGVTVG